MSPKPIKLAVLTTVLRRTSENNRNHLRFLASKMEQTRNERDPFLGKSKAIQNLKYAALRISDSARRVIQKYSWPGNIRELRNVQEQAALLSDDGEIHRTGLELEERLSRRSRHPRLR